MKILLIAPPHEASSNFLATLNKHRFNVDRASNPEAAWALLSSFTYDLLLLEASPEGIRLCHHLRQVGNPVLILLTVAAPDLGTPLPQVNPGILGLERGADAYLTHPIDERELLAHIHTLTRRRRGGASPVLSWGPVHLHSVARKVTCHGQVLPVNRKEYQLLELFLSHPHQTFSRGVISDRLWSLDDPLPTDATIKTHIRNLRRKLEQAGLQDLIQTHYGHGYRLNPAHHPGAERTKDHPPQPDTMVDTVTAQIWQELISANSRLHEEIEQRQRITEVLQRSERMLSNAQRVAQIGCWEFDIDTQTTYWTEELYRIHGLDPSQPAPPPEALLTLIHPEDHLTFQEAILKPVAQQQPFETNLRIIRQDGEIRYVNARGGPIWDENGKLTKLAGTFFDITAWVLGDGFPGLGATLANSQGQDG
jgi:PAS domain S-box-containing protein